MVVPVARQLMTLLHAPDEPPVALGLPPQDEERRADPARGDKC